MLDVSDKLATFPQLETERCILREITEDDLQDMFEFMSDGKVTQYLPWNTATTLEMPRKYIDRYQTIFAEQTGVIWGIINKEHNKMMGTCLLFNFNLPHFRAELGYALGSSWWRQGFMLEVTSRVVDYAFTNLHFHSLEAHIDPNNIGSESLLKKLGFVQEAYFREDYYDKDTETFTDTAIFSLLETGWDK
ncbi:MAG: GNAT family N-acetyltransferase [Phototrophicaceae bacterium]